MPALAAAALCAAAAGFAGLGVAWERRARLVRLAGLARPRSGAVAGGSVRIRRPRRVRRDVLPAVLLTLLALRLGGVFLAAVGCGVWMAVRAHLSRRGRRRNEELMRDQVADAVNGVAAALRAGMSLPQALRFSAKEASPPMSVELNAVCDRSDLGLALDSVLEEWAERRGDPDLALAAGVLVLHHRVGGRAPAVLEHAAGVLRDRRAAAVELRSQTSQARLSGSILAALPAGFFAFLAMISPGQLRETFGTALGVGAVLGGLLLDGLAFLWIRRILRLEPA